MAERSAEGASRWRVSAAGWVGPAALLVLFSALLAWSWRKWTDVHVDFGNELYIAWQLSEGKALYRDIAHRNGPLSHVLNGLLFSAFGVSIRTLVLANLVVLGAICAALWRLFGRACGPGTATLLVAVLLLVFAFGQYAGIANFNYVTPYHHFQTHGLALSLGMLLCFGAAARGGGAWPVFGAGLCLGAVFLTKAELFVPALLAALAAFAARATARPGVFAAGFGLPVVAFGAWLGAQMSWDVALTGLLGNWAHLGGTLSDPFYRAGAGLDDPVGNVARAGLALLALGAFAAAAALVDRALAGSGRRATWAVLLGGLLFAGLVAAGLRFPWLHLARVLPFTSAAAAVWLGLRLRRAQAAERARLLPLFLFAVYATVLLAKLGLAPRFHQYGFVLAAPATLLLVAAAMRAGLVARALSLAVVAAACVFFVSLSQLHYRHKTFTVGRGPDAILAKAPPATPRPALVARTLADLETRMRPGDTLLVMPEGISLNYWLRRENPTRFNLFLPTEIRAFGEEAMLAALEAHAPDFVVLVHRPAGELGVGPFGRDPRFGSRLVDWVEAHYRRVQRFGAEPFTGQGFGTVVLERSLR